MTKDSQTPQASKNPERAKRRLATSDMIAGAALLLSTAAFAWRVSDAWQGPELSLLPLENRVVEFRCTSGKERCWETPPPGRSPGRVSAIAPVFAANRGAADQNEVLESAALAFTPNTRTAPVDLSAIAFWAGTGASKIGDDGPFAPVLVPGAGVAGSEVRFTAFSDSSRISWREFAQEIVSGKLTDIAMELTVQPVVEGDPLSVQCTAPISDRARATLERRMEEMGSPYLSLICD